MYKVSVIVPIYNVERYLDRCLTSIINQTYKNLEIILVNDGSTDNSREIAKGYTTLDNRVKLYDKQNGGLSDARNYGINKATGDYVLYVDSDDWLDITMINTMIEEVKKYNADVVQVDFYYAYEDHLLYDDRFVRFLQNNAGSRPRSQRLCRKFSAFLYSLNCRRGRLLQRSSFPRQALNRRLLRFRRAT